jgi:hypothetical protein
LLKYGSDRFELMQDLNVTKLRFLTFMDVDVSSDEPEETFLKLESRLRDHYVKDLEAADGNWEVLVAKRDFFNDVHAAASYLGIRVLADFRRPNTEERSDHGFFEEFFDELDYCVAGLLLAAADQNKTLSSQLDDAARKSIRRLISRMREQVGALDLGEAKKNLIERRIAALEAELENRHTRWGVFGALLIEMATDVGTATEKMEPVWRTVERIGEALGLAKKTEATQRQLPPRKEPKQLPAPKRAVADDEIPF